MTSSIQLFEHTLPIGNIESYIYWANKVPFLSKEEELELATKLKQNGDLDAARKLVLSHLRFVVKIARGYLSYGLQQADLIQEGNIGLMKAVKRFDPNVGVRLVSFSVHWIKAEIHEFILRNWRIVRMATTKEQRKLFFNLRKIAHKIGRIGWFTKDEIAFVAKELKVKPKEVINMEMRLNGRDISLDIRDDEEDDSHNRYHGEYLNLEDQSETADPASFLEKENLFSSREQHLTSALLQLDDRSRDILKQRWLSNNKPTLHELASKYNVSAERVRQLEGNALRKIKSLITKLMQNK